MRYVNRYYPDYLIPAFEFKIVSMNTPLLLGWAATFLCTILALHKWSQRRERNRRVSRGLRSYASGVELG